MKTLILLTALFISVNLLAQDSTKNNITFTGVEMKFNNSFNTVNPVNMTPSIGIRTGILFQNTKLSISIDNNLNSKMLYFYKNFTVNLEVSYKIIK